MERNVTAENEAGGALTKLVGLFALFATVGAVAGWQYLGKGIDKTTDASRTAFDKAAESPTSIPEVTSTTTEPPEEEEMLATTTTTKKTVSTTKVPVTKVPVTTSIKSPTTTSSTAPAVTSSTTTVSTTTKVPTPGERAYSQAQNLYQQVRGGTRPIRTIDSCRILEVNVTGTNPGNFMLKEVVLFDVGSNTAVLGGWVDDDNAPNHGEPIIVGHNATIISDAQQSTDRKYCGPQSKILFYDPANTHLEGLIPEASDLPAEKTPVGTAEKIG
ncbi:MAG: hypothetical protein V4702_02375 [Patescibacteria group bacterium]